MAEKYPSPSEKVDELSGESPNKDVCTSQRPVPVAMACVVCGFRGTCRVS